MVEQPPLKPRRGHTARRAAAITALLVGLLVVGAIAWQVSAHTGTSSPPPPPPPTTTGPPPQKVLHIVFPEGFTIRDMAARITAVDKIAESKRKVTPRLSAKAYLRAVATMQLPPAFKSFGRPKSLEGFLFPATYAFTKTTTGEQLVGQQLQAFQRAWAHLDLAYARQKNLTPYDVLIIASMIEKEVVAPKERPLVAAVIYNRLHVGFPVGIDATLRYGLHIPPTEAIHLSQLESDNPYNTRKFAGLTPTPIANPGLASMQAAAHPAHVDYLYFVRKPDCKHHFFTANEQQFLNYPRAGLSC